MGEIDALLHKFIWKYVVPFIGVCLVIYYYRGYFRRLYQRTIFAWIISKLGARFDRGMRGPKGKLLSSLKVDAAKKGKGFTILEIGVGGGSNFSYYPDGAHLIMLDPIDKFEDYINETISKYDNLTTEFRVGYAENMRAFFADESIDAVIFMHVLCSVKDVDACLREALRVLVPGGKAYFMEHVCAEENTWVHFFQELVQPLWTIIGDGCQLNRKTWLKIENAGFSQVHLEKFDLKLRTALPIVKPHIQGIAVK